ncbi:MAG: DUF86 domain-containing protein [Leptolyngbya sp. SIO1E4]|nr:DUF86 domain-containing protein [Leptolyngbya sp. SIO1E4]
MTKRALSEYLDDILAAIADIEAFTDGIDFNEFRENREKVLAVVKSIEILGEATKKIPDEVRRAHPQVAWRSITGMRDMLVHEYWGIDMAVVWSTVEEGIPSLKAVIMEIKRSV